MVENITIIKGTDGPTAVFLAGKNHRYTLRQKIKKYIFNRKMKFVEKSLKPEGHTVDEVIYYAKNKYGFEEADKDSDEYKEEYNQMRSSFIIQYKPELLGDLTSEPELKGTSEQDMLELMEQNAKRMERAQNVPKDLFDIDYHKLIKRFNDKKRVTTPGPGAYTDKKNYNLAKLSEQKCLEKKEIIFKIRKNETCL